MKTGRMIACVILASTLSAGTVSAADFTDTAQVVSSTPIIERVVETRQECMPEATPAPQSQDRSLVGPIVGGIAVGLLRLVRNFDSDKTADFFASVTRAVGPWLPEQKIGRANLKAAFPEKSAAEIETILTGVWDNLGRVGSEFAQIDRIWDFDQDRAGTGRIEIAPESVERFLKLRDDGKGALLFASHLANWELPALAGPAYGLDSAILFRRPNIASVDRAVQSIRALNMGTMIATTHDAPL